MIDIGFAGKGIACLGILFSHGVESDAHSSFGPRLQLQGVVNVTPNTEINKNE
jgi:hypothetical protein